MHGVQRQFAVQPYGRDRSSLNQGVHALGNVDLIVDQQPIRHQAAEDLGHKALIGELFIRKAGDGQMLIAQLQRVFDPVDQRRWGSTGHRRVCGFSACAARKGVKKASGTV